jgi:hypothetical protein
MVKKICVNLRDLRAKQLYLKLETDQQHWMKIYFIGGGGFFYLGRWTFITPIL